MLGCGGKSVNHSGKEGTRKKTSIRGKKEKGDAEKTPHQKNAPRGQKKR